jgi:hypothetical protein
MGLHAVIRLVAILVAAAAIAGGWVALDPMLRERLMGDVPEARIGDYLAATQRGDAAAAVAMWPMRELPPVAGLAQRRDDTTARLVAAHATLVRVERIEWWRTCCDPGTIDDPRSAGLARATVVVRTSVGDERLIFDVLAKTTTYWGAAAGNPPHEWTVRDIYPEGAAPLFFRFRDGAG